MITKAKTDKYTEGIGRRKTSVARVRITPASKNSYKINEKDLAAYFVTLEMQKMIEEALELAGTHFEVSVQVKGGGIHSQAEAVRHGIARAIALSDNSLRDKVKQAGFLKRDPRAKERRKFGLKKARKAPQWSKR